MTLKNRLVWGCICAVLLACATLGVLLAQSHGGFGWWIFLIHPRDPATLLGVFTAPLFSATLYEWINNTCVVFALLLVGSAYGKRFARDGMVLWLMTGAWVWGFGNGSLYYMGFAPLSAAVCAWLVTRAITQRHVFHTIAAVGVTVFTLYTLPPSLLCVGPVMAAVVLARR